MLMALGAGIGAEREILLVESYGKLMLIGMDGVQRSVAPSIGLAALSPDGRNVAFTQNENPRETAKFSDALCRPGGRRKRAAGRADSTGLRTLNRWDGCRMETPSSFREKTDVSLSRLSRPVQERRETLAPGTRIQRVAGRNENSSRGKLAGHGSRNSGCLVREADLDSQIIANCLERNLFRPMANGSRMRRRFGIRRRPKDDDPELHTANHRPSLVFDRDEVRFCMTIASAPRDWDNVVRTPGRPTASGSR